MSTDIYYFRGIAEWAKVHKPDEKFQVYTIDLFLDRPSQKLFKDSHLQLELREDKPDKGVYVKFRRPETKLVKKEVISVGPPTVLIRKEGTEDYIPFSDPIGNGSEVTIKVSVFDTMKGKGHQLEVVAVEELIPYSLGQSFAPDGKELPF